jgi:type III restriction enzyme
MDLYDESGRRSVYQGWLVEDIHVARDGEPGFVEFSNGRKVREGLGTASDSEQHQRLMIRQAIESHFEKEFQLKLQQRRGLIPAAVKPLTLFFIDKVANYHPDEGKFRQWFEQEYEFVRSDARYRTLAMPDVDEVHDGYFATTPKGVPKDTAFGRDTKDSESAFERIMRNKEKLLSFDEPLRFIFSHSALVEGWDNPNVFTICNLQDGKSEMRKRQQRERQREKRAATHLDVLGRLEAVKLVEKLEHRSLDLRVAASSARSAARRADRVDLVHNVV